MFWATRSPGSCPPTWLHLDSLAPHRCEKHGNTGDSRPLTKWTFSAAACKWFLNPRSVLWTSIVWTWPRIAMRTASKNTLLMVFARDCAPHHLYFFYNNFLPLFFSSKAKNLYRYHIVRWYNVSNITNIYTYTDVSLIKPSPGPLIAETREIDESPRMKSVSTLMSLHIQEPSRA